MKETNTVSLLRLTIQFIDSEVDFSPKCNMSAAAAWTYNLS